MQKAQGFHYPVHCVLCALVAALTLSQVLFLSVRSEVILPSYSLQVGVCNAHEPISTRSPWTQAVDHKQRAGSTSARTAAAGGGREAAVPVAKPGGPSPHVITASAAIILQGFGWESHRKGEGTSWWSKLRGMVPRFKEAGFSHVWLPPPSASVAPQGYMPTQLYNLNSAYGTPEELGALNWELTQAGIAPVADIVINHRSADEKDSRGRWMVYRDDVDHPGRRLDWGEDAITCDDPVFPGEGHPDTGEDFAGAPDLDHLSAGVQAGLADWLCWLQDQLGFRGWRFDFAKGYSPHFTAWYMEGLAGGGLCVGEYWTDLRWQGGSLDYDQSEAIGRLQGWTSAAGCLAFDFPTKGIVQEAVKRTQFDRLRGREGRGPGLLGTLPAAAVTFVDNHDTGSSQQLWPWPCEGVMLGYAYILTHPGTPTVFWEHMYEWGLEAQIQQLMGVRRRAGICSDSQLKIIAAEWDLYMALVGGDSVLVKVGPRMELGPLLPEEDVWRLAASGPDYAVWERAPPGGQAAHKEGCLQDPLEA